MRKKGTGYVTDEGYVYTKKNGVSKFEHVRIVENILGKALPKGAGVHHVNGVKGDNRNTNLVVYPTQKYHFLIHRRADAYNETGDANSRRCWVCKNYDAPENLYINGSVSVHKQCKARYDKDRKSK